MIWHCIKENLPELVIPTVDPSKSDYVLVCNAGNGTVAVARLFKPVENFAGDLFWETSTVALGPFHTGLDYFTHWADLPTLPSPIPGEEP